MSYLTGCTFIIVRLAKVIDCVLLYIALFHTVQLRYINYFFPNKIKLEIWGRAQHEAAVSPTGETIKGVEIPLVATSRVESAVALAYTARAVLILSGSTCARVTFC